MFVTTIDLSSAIGQEAQEVMCIIVGKNLLIAVHSLMRGCVLMGFIEGHTWVLYKYMSIFMMFSNHLF